jgi:hypothetical protein
MLVSLPSLGEYIVLANKAAVDVCGPLTVALSVRCRDRLALFVSVTRLS